MMRADDRVLIEGVIGVMSRPAVDQLDRFELWHTGGDDGPDLLLPDAVVLGEIVIGYGRIIIGRTAGKIIAPLRTHMHARGVDGEGKVAGQRLLGIKDEAVAFARLNWQV